MKRMGVLIDRSEQEVNRLDLSPPQGAESERDQVGALMWTGRIE